MLYHQLA